MTEFSRCASTERQWQSIQRMRRPQERAGEHSKKAPASARQLAVHTSQKTALASETKLGISYPRHQVLQEHCLLNQTPRVTTHTRSERLPTQLQAVSTGRKPCLHAHSKAMPTRGRQRSGDTVKQQPVRPQAEGGHHQH